MFGKPDRGREVLEKKMSKFTNFRQEGLGLTEASTAGPEQVLLPTEPQNDLYNPNAGSYTVISNMREPEPTDTNLFLMMQAETS